MSAGVAHIVQVCLNRVEKVLNTAPRSFYEGQAENIIFVTALAEKLFPALRYDHTLRMLALWRSRPTTDFPVQVEFVEKLVLRTPPPPHPSAVTTPWDGDEEFCGSIRRGLWGDATKVVVLDWITLSVNTPRTLASLYRVAGEQLHLLLQAPGVLFKRGTGELSDKSSKWCYLVTHLFYISTFWFTQESMEFQVSEGDAQKMLVLFASFKVSPSRWKNNLEVVLEWVSCLGALAKDDRFSTATRNELQHEVQWLRAELLRPEWMARVSNYAVTPSGNPLQYGKEYFYHLDYHTHLLVAQFLGIS